MGGGTRMRVRQVLSQGEHALKQCQATESRTCSSDRKCPQNCVHVSCRYRRHPTTGQYAVQVFHHRKGSDDYVHHCKIYEQQGRNECVCSCDAFYSSGTQGSPLSPIVPRQAQFCDGNNCLRQLAVTVTSMKQQTSNLFYFVHVEIR